MKIATTNQTARRSTQFVGALLVALSAMLLVLTTVPLLLVHSLGKVQRSNTAGNSMQARNDVQEQNVIYGNVRSLVDAKPSQTKKLKLKTRHVIKTTGDAQHAPIPVMAKRNNQEQRQSAQQAATKTTLFSPDTKIICSRRAKEYKMMHRGEPLNGGVFYDLRSMWGEHEGDRLQAKTDTIDYDSAVLIVNLHSRVSVEERKKKYPNAPPIKLMMDMMRSDWTGMIGTELPLDESVLSQHDYHVAMTISWKMNMYQLDSIPLWAALYGAKEADFDVEIQAVAPYVGTVDVPPALGLQVQNTDKNGCLAGITEASRNQPSWAIPIGQENFAQPKRMPFYKTAHGGPSPPKVTICTQLTINRLTRLDAMARSWQGPISAVMYIGYRGDRDQEMAELNEYWDQSDALRKFVDLHVVYKSEKEWFTWEGMVVDPYPINLLRQIAVEYARTEYIMYAEGDMVPSPGGHDIIAFNWDKLLAMDDPAQHGGTRAAITVPLYYTEICPDDLLEEVPATKKALVEASNAYESDAIKNRKGGKGLRRMSRRYPNCLDYDYDGWEAADPNNPDRLFLPYDGKKPEFKYVPPERHRTPGGKTYTRNMNGQEPYFIIHKASMPPYDVLFWSRLGDKTTHVADIISQGFRFLIHRDVFFVNFADNNVRDRKEKPPDDVKEKGKLRVVTRKNRHWDWIARDSGKDWRWNFIPFIHQKMTGNTGMS